MASERSVVSVQRRSATMSGPESGRCFRNYSLVAVPARVSSCAHGRAKDLVHSGDEGWGGVVACVSRALSTMLCCKTAEVEHAWLHGWDGMVERHDRPNPSR